MNEDEFVVVAGKSVIHNNVNPLSKVPETEVEDAGIATILPPLTLWDNLGEEEREGGEEVMQWPPHSHP